MILSVIEYTYLNPIFVTNLTTPDQLYPYSSLAFVFVLTKIGSPTLQSGCFVSSTTNRVEEVEEEEIEEEEEEEERAEVYSFLFHRSYSIPFIIPFEPLFVLFLYQYAHQGAANAFSCSCIRYLDMGSSN